MACGFVDPGVRALVSLVREEMNAEHAALEAPPGDPLGPMLRSHSREVRSRRRREMELLSSRLESGATAQCRLQTILTLLRSLVDGRQGR